MPVTMGNMGIERERDMRQKAVSHIVRQIEERQDGRPDRANGLIFRPAADGQIVDTRLPRFIRQFGEERTRDMKDKGFEISANCDGRSLPQADQTDRAFRVGLDRSRGAIKPDIAVFDIDQIEDHKERIIGREIDDIVTIVVLAPKVRNG